MERLLRATPSRQSNNTARRIVGQQGTYIRLKSETPEYFDESLRVEEVASDKLPKNLCAGREGRKQTR